MKSSDPVTNCGCDAMGNLPEAKKPRLSDSEKISLLENIISRKLPLQTLGLLTVAVLRPGLTQHVMMRIISHGRS